MRKKEAKKKIETTNKIDMDNGSFPYAKDIGRTLAKTILSPSHRAIIDCILDMTYGWYDPRSKKIDKLKKRKTKELITYRTFENFTGIMRNHLSKYILELVNWKVIKRREKGQYYIYSLNVNVSQWNKGIFRESVTRTGDTSKSVPQTGDSSVPQTGDTLALKQGTLAESKTNEKVNKNKALRDSQKSPKETISNNLYKKREKEDIYIDKNLREKEIFDYWNSLDIFEHKTFDFFKDDIGKALKNYSSEEIKDTIKNYSIILKGGEYYYSHEYMISGFLEPQNFEKFRDLEKAKKNYLRRKVNSEIDSGEYDIPKYEPEKIKDDKNEEEKRVERAKNVKRAGEIIKELKEKKGD